MLVKGYIQFVHVSLVVLGVMYLHRTRIDIRLERIIFVRECWKGVACHNTANGKRFLYALVTEAVALRINQ